MEASSQTLSQGTGVYGVLGKGQQPKYVLKGSFVSSKRPKRQSHYPDSGLYEPPWLLRQRRSDSVDENQSSCTFVPFNELIAEDDFIKPRIADLLEKEFTEKLIREKTGNESVGNSTVALNDRRGGTRANLTRKNIMLKKTRQIQTLNKLAKPSTRTNARLATPNKSTASLRHTQDDQSDDDLCLNHSIIPLSRPFIDRQLKASMNHLEEYRHHVHSRLNSIHLAIVDKVKQATKIEACLMRMTQVIPKQTDGNALGFQVDGTGRKESEQEEQEYEDSIVKTAKQDLLTTNVRSYGCLVKTFSFTNDYPLARANPYVTFYSTELDSTGLKENKLLICGGFGLKLMTDVHELSLSTLTWKSRVGVSHSANSDAPKPGLRRHSSP
jgi:hypothetical protein